MEKKVCALLEQKIKEEVYFCILHVTKLYLIFEVILI